MSDRDQRTRMLLGDGVDRLAGAHVAVFGLGGVGGYAAEGLARAGVGRLTLVDFDTVEESNLNRQIIALAHTVGQPKAALMAERVRAINPDIQVDACAEMYTASNRGLLTSDMDYVVDAIDTPPAKADLIHTALSMGLSIVSCMGVGNRLDPSRLKIGELFAVTGCPFARRIKRELTKLGHTSHTALYSEEPPAKIPPPPGGGRAIGSVSWVPSVAGMMLCGYIVMSLLEKYRRQ